MKKALLKAGSPSLFFKYLRDMGQLKDWFRELDGWDDDAWNRSIEMIDRAASLRDRAKEPLAFMIAAVCHVVTEREGVGPEDAMRMLKRMTREQLLLKYAENMLTLLREPRMLLREGASEHRFCKMFDQSLCPEDLLLLVQAETLANDRGAEAADQTDIERQDVFFQRMLEKYRCVMDQPFVQGADLVAAGFAPGKDFSEALKAAHEYRLAGYSKEAQLLQAMTLLKDLRKDAK